MAAAYQAVFLFVVCGLFQGMNACNVKCTTDYMSMLNCSTSASAGPASFDVEAKCSDESDYVNGTCVIRPPQAWCIIKPERFYFLANPDTKCVIKLKQSNQQEECNSTVALDSVIKPNQPFNLALTESNGSFNLSWEMVDVPELEGDLMYKVCLKPKEDLDETHCKEFYINEDRRHQEIPCKMLLPGQAYVASIQAKVNPQSHFFPKSEWNEWSERSTSSAWTCPHTDSLDLSWQNHYLLWLMLLVVPLLILLFVFGKLGWLKKLAHFLYIPNPQYFFKPLYHTYQGDFKKWVGPVLTFNSFDILEKSVPLQVLSEKQLAALPLQRELLHDPGSGGSGLGDWSLLSLVNPGSSKRYFLGGSSLGHISMDTVTVSDQEGTMSDWDRRSSRNRPDPSFHGANQRAPGVSDEDDVLGLDEREGLNERGYDDDMDHIEEISLDSFSSNEHQDDGYPQMGLDLDTIDSGFLESDCSSPVNSECDGSDQMDAALLDAGVGAHSNYVKQWVAFIPMSESQSSSEL